MTKLLILGILVASVALILPILKKKSGEKEKPDLSVYEKKPFLFDAVSELNLYRMLLELYGEKYHIFTQVNYSHLIQPKKTNFQDERRYRSRIDRKSADFVLCDKERVVPQLIIELDGYVHNFKNKKARDEFVDDITKVAGLPIVHLKTNELDRKFIESEINKKLG